MRTRMRVCVSCAYVRVCVNDSGGYVVKPLQTNYLGHIPAWLATPYFLLADDAWSMLVTYLLHVHSSPSRVVPGTARML